MTNKLAICCNHSYPHVGGTEKVTRQIAESMVNKFGYDVSVYSFSLKRPLENKGVKYLPCPTAFASFCNHIEAGKYTHLFVYSDCFRHWPSLLRASASRTDRNQITCRKSIALVGMNHMREHTGDMRVWKQKQHGIIPVTHSSVYHDYRSCHTAGMEPVVIPNGVDTDEFDNNDIKFRTKYDIKTKHLIICVANFFPGKGQEHLLNVFDRLHSRKLDFTAVFISNQVNFPYARVLSNKVEHALKRSKYQNRFMVNLPREDVVAAFNAADVFAFPTEKEVAPIVALESMASLTPWVALPVGNMTELDGGLLAPVRSYTKDDYAKWSEITYQVFSDSVERFLNEEEFAQDYASKGRQQIEEKFNWKKIPDQYHALFDSEKHAEA